MPSIRRMLLASSLAPLAAAVPIFAFGIYVWTEVMKGPFAQPVFGSITPVGLAMSFAAPFYAALFFGTFVVGLSLRALNILKLRYMLQTCGAVSFSHAVWLSVRHTPEAQVHDSVFTIAAQVLAFFALLCLVTFLWCRVALRVQAIPARPK
ncbi:MAG: hypothetical protein KF892_23475 [Rhizobacter sp.]|nr:hypothetical protein [Rhizobacter sp.]